ncbi:MAG: 3-deoxy-D-manno-octulosonic acid transferase [Rikenellaceae bacterium]|nr:3-deoxy-D-manno-octulosonic acid transferase [Rikenellaceae bacterium]
MGWLYDLGIYAMQAGIALAALFNPKARLWRQGRRDIFRRLADTVGRDDGRPVAWFHAASLGEFEQGRPVIEELRRRRPGYKILVTFFSPSGYEIRKNYSGADYIFYLPADTPRNARRFMRIVRPELAFFVKYEFWLNYLAALRRSDCRTFIISAIFRADSVFFKWYGGAFRRALHTFERLFVQNAESQALLRTIGVTNVSVAGDTRFDRVCEIASATRELDLVHAFAGDSRVVVCGSTWPPDEELLLRLIGDFPALKFIVAPHEIVPSRIERLIARSPRRAVRYTQLASPADLAGAEVLVVDTIGILSSVYRYGTYAYIGGGFGVGIHNILEAATFGLPLAFGPNYHRFKEACDLVAMGGAASIDAYEPLRAWLGGLEADAALRARASRVCADYVADNRGATATILGAL